MAKKNPDCKREGYSRGCNGDQNNGGKHCDNCPISNKYKDERRKEKSRKFK